MKCSTSTTWYLDRAAWSRSSSSCRGSHSPHRNQHAARTRPAVSGIGHRRGCSTCSRLLVEQRRGPASVVTQVLVMTSRPVFRPFRFGGHALRRVWLPPGRMPLAARHCAGRRVAGAGRVVKPSRCAGKGWAFLDDMSRSAARSCAVHSTKACPRAPRPRDERPSFGEQGGGAEPFAKLSIRLCTRKEQRYTGKCHRLTTTLTERHLCPTHLGCVVVVPFGTPDSQTHQRATAPRDSFLPSPLRPYPYHPYSPSPTLSPTAVPPHATPQPTAPLRAAGARRATAGGRSSSARTRRACRRGSRACRPSWS